MFKKFFKSNDFDKETKKAPALSWKSLQSEAQLEDIKAQSNVRLQIIYKHSSSCGISSMVQRQLEKSLLEFNGRADFYFLEGQKLMSEILHTTCYENARWSLTKKFKNIN